MCIYIYTQKYVLYIYIYMPKYCVPIFTCIDGVGHRTYVHNDNTARKVLAKRTEVERSGTKPGFHKFFSVSWFSTLGLGAPGSLGLGRGGTLVCQGYIGGSGPYRVLGC